MAHEQQYKRLDEQNLLKGYSILFIQKAFTEAGTILQKSEKQDEISNKNKKKLFFKRTYYHKSLPNKTLQATYSNTLDCINLFDNMIVCNKRPKNVRDVLMPSSLKQISGKNPSDILQEVSNHHKMR